MASPSSPGEGEAPSFRSNLVLTMQITNLIDDGLRVTLPDGTTKPLWRYLAPLALLMTSASLLVVSTLLPYWSMDLEAPQYPDGLRVEVFIDHLSGDVDEIDELNHYLGLPPLEDGGQLERRIAIPAALGIAGVTLAALAIRNRVAWLFIVPVATFPVAFLADLWYILYTYGHSIDPTSALGGAIDPFTPPLFGRGQVGQFASVAHAELGLYLSALASVIGLLGLWALRSARKPVQVARKNSTTNAPSARPNERGA